MKKLFIALGSIEAFVALGAIPAGLGYLSDTTGAGMGNSTAMLANSPLHSFLLPALFLLFINGFCNLAGAVLSFRRSRLAGWWGLAMGIILCLWIIVQVWWITLSSFMQPLFFGVGIVMIALAWLIIRKQKASQAQ